MAFSEDELLNPESFNDSHDLQEWHYHIRMSFLFSFSDGAFIRHWIIWDQAWTTISKVKQPRPSYYLAFEARPQELFRIRKPFAGAVQLFNLPFPDQLVWLPFPNV